MRWVEQGGRKFLVTEPGEVPPAKLRRLDFPSEEVKGEVFALAVANGVSGSREGRDLAASILERELQLRGVDVPAPEVLQQIVTVSYPGGAAALEDDYPNVAEVIDRMLRASPYTVEENLRVLFPLYDEYRQQQKAKREN
jgi:hypothetical protein